MNNKMQAIHNKHQRYLDAIKQHCSKKYMQTKIKLLIHTDYWQQSLLLIHLELVAIEIHIQIVLFSVRIQCIINLVPFFLYINNPYSYFFLGYMECPYSFTSVKPQH